MTLHKLLQKLFAELMGMATMPLNRTDIEKSCTASVVCVCWWSRPDSNGQPEGYESARSIQLSYGTTRTNARRCKLRALVSLDDVAKRGYVRQGWSVSACAFVIHCDALFSQAT